MLLKPIMVPYKGLPVRKKIAIYKSCKNHEQHCIGRDKGNLLMPGIPLKKGFFYTGDIGKTGNNSSHLHPYVKRPVQGLHRPFSFSQNDAGGDAGDLRLTAFAEPPANHRLVNPLL